jgi:hypothetical protein
MRVAIHEKNLVTFRCERFEQKHPEVRHEVVGNFIIRIVEQNIHSDSASLLGREQREETRARMKPADGNFYVNPTD